MKWWEIAVETTDSGIEAVSGAFMRAGIQNLSIEESHEAVARALDDAKLYWDFADTDLLGSDVPRVLAYVAELPENEPIIAQVKENVAALRDMELPFDLGSLVISVRSVDEEDWANNWKKNYRPLAIGEKLLVVPSWETVEDDGGRKQLILDPGMAFGTGAHHTTRMCLELLEECIAHGAKIIDLGCGSGILSIAGLLLGASHAVAVDIDPIARDIVLENVSRNAVDASHYEIHIGDVLSDEAMKGQIAGQYDIILANIVADVIIRLAPFAKTLTKPGTPFIVSGIITDRKDEVLETLKANGFALEKVIQSEDWVAIRARA